MSIEDKIFIAIMNLALIIFLFTLNEANKFVDGSKWYLPFIVPVILIVIILVMFFIKRDDNTKDKPIR